MIHYIKFITNIRPLSASRFISYNMNISRSWFSEHKQVPAEVQEHKFFKMIKDLQDESYVMGLIEEEQKLRQLPEGKYATFKHLRLKINDLLHLRRLLTWAQAYHTSFSISSSQQAMEKIEHLCG